MSFYSKKYLEPTSTSKKEFFAKNSLRLKAFHYFRKKANGIILSQCKIANYDLILTVLLLFALIFFKGPQQCNRPPIYGGYVPSE